MRASVSEESSPVRVDRDRELCDLASKAAACAELLTVSRDAATDARADVRDAIALLQAFERRLVKRIGGGFADV
jgi:hypothetical protein